MEEFSAWETYCYNDEVSGDSNDHLYAGDIIILNFSDITASAIGRVRLYRDATDSADTYDGDAKLLQFDIHIYQDKLGADP